MTKITENDIELLAIERLEALGFEYRYAPVFAHDGDAPERDSYEQVLLLDRLTAAVRRLNPDIPRDAQLDAIREIQRLHAPDLLTNNQAFHKLLTEGVPVNYQKAGQTRGDRVWLVDFEEPENNEFLVAEPIYRCRERRAQTP